MHSAAALGVLTTLGVALLYGPAIVATPPGGLGITHTVEVVRGGDAGELVNRSVLTAGNPEADVMFGVDNTFLSAALDADVFEARSESAVDEFADVIDPALLDEQNRVVPVDFGDVCLNYDRAWFEENDLAPPGSLVALTDPTYRGLTVVEDPTTSSPGMAFMLSTIAKFGEGADEGFENFWAALRENEVAVVAGWEEAYYGRFTWGSEGEGDRPIVVSYASSPPVDVIFGEYATPPDVAPTAVIEDGCFRQVEYAGVMAGTDNSDAAGELVDFMLTEDFQADIPLKMFVFPIRDDIELPEEFVKYTSVPEEPSRMEPAEIDANRSDWLDTWDEVMAG